MQHSCGHPRHVCSDPGRQWFPQLEVCHVTREQQAAFAAYERLHEKRPWHNGDMTSWVETPDEAHPYRYDHGVTVWAAAEDHGHGGAFTTQEDPYRYDHGVTVWAAAEDHGHGGAFTTQEDPWRSLDGVDEVEGG